MHPDSPAINPLNKLISISSANSLTLAEAMFVTALAKAEYRDQICQRFDYYLLNELPKQDVEWMRTNKIKNG